MKSLYNILRTTIFCLTLPISLSAQWQPQNNASTDVGPIYHLNGDVGIGTATPSHTLSLYRNTNANLGIVTNQSNSEASLWFRINSTVKDAGIIYRSNGRLSFNLDNSDGGYVESNEYMTILSSGNIGMGTNTPYLASRLHIKALMPGLWASITEASSNQRIIGVGHDGNAGFVSVSYLGNDGYSPLYFNTSNLTRLAIAVDGKIGVGLTDPSHLVQINDLNNPTLAIGKANVDNNGKSSIAFFAGKSGVANAFTLQYRREPNVDRLAFLDGGNQERLTIVNGGNVGIGTVNPDARLAVKGTVHAEEVKVDLNVPVPDYVFEKNYDLRSLAEVEAYINQNKHLPEIPAAKEMEKDGVNIGEMNMMLLKKVEELTLYVIELKKEIEKQQSEIKAIKK